MIGAIFGRAAVQIAACILLCGTLSIAVAAEDMPAGAKKCSTTGDTAAIALSNVAARLNGVSPLAVFFDAAGTTATATTKPFHELEYRWNFGDPASGAWANGARPGVSSRNAATGPVAAHVYEPAFGANEATRTYTVTLTVTDGTNTVQNACTQIVVQNPDDIPGAPGVFAGANTVCVGASALPIPGQGGCPAGATAVMQSSFTTAINTYARTGKRVLFKRGDTFVVPTALNQYNQQIFPTITQTGPGVVGSFGAGSLPVIQVTAALTTMSATFLLSSRFHAFSDWRLMDLELDGMNGRNTAGIGNLGGVTQITLLRLTMRRFEGAAGIGDGIANYWNNNALFLNRPDLGGHKVDQIALVDSRVDYGTNSSIQVFLGGNRLALMGNYVDGGGLQDGERFDGAGTPIPGGGSHNTRFAYLNKAVISNNSLQRPGSDRHGIKLHAPARGVLPGMTVPGPDPDNPATAGNRGMWSNYSPVANGDGWTKEIVISDNKLVDFKNGWSIVVGPRNNILDERVKDVIMERNLHVGTPYSAIAQVLRAHQVTSRNNLIVQAATTSNHYASFLVDQDGPEPPARDVWVYHNTSYSLGTSAANILAVVQIRDTTVSNLFLKNNLAYAPAAVANTTRFYDNSNFVTGVGVVFGNDALMNVVVAGNSTNAQIKTVTAPFTVPASLPLLSPPFTVPDGFLNSFSPVAGSYAIGAGTPVPVWSDFFGTPRPASGAPDIGAVKAP